MRITFSVVMTALLLLAGVGLIDLWKKESFVFGALYGVPRTDMTDAEKVHAAALTEGPFGAATDHHVGIIMKRGITRELLGVPATMDVWGQRVRVGPPAETGAPRIVVLGDSIAFGFGVADDETIGHNLERFLGMCTRPGSKKPVVFTVACPGWNQRNATRYLRNHLARLDPDIVLFLPVGNDLHDGYAVGDAGHRTMAFDPTHGASQPHTSAEQWNLLMLSNYKNAPVSEWNRIRQAGGILATVPHVVVSGITRESKRRWAGLVEDMVELTGRLEARGTKLATVFCADGGYEEMFHVRVGRALPQHAFLWTYANIGDGDHLDGDPHPNAKYTKAVAWRVADFLLRGGWVAGTDHEALPNLPLGYQERLMAARTIDGSQAVLAGRQRIWEDFFRSEVVIRDTTGFHQVYGAVHAHGTVRRTLWLALKNPGTGRISVDLRRLPAASGVYPLTLRVTIQGVAAGEVPVPPPGGDDLRYRAQLRVPPELLSEPYLDVRLDASNWVVESHGGQSRLASFRLDRIGFDG